MTIHGQITNASLCFGNCTLAIATTGRGSVVSVWLPPSLPTRKPENVVLKPVPWSLLIVESFVSMNSIKWAIMIVLPFTKSWNNKLSPLPRLVFTLLLMPVAVSSLLQIQFGVNTVKLLPSGKYSPSWFAAGVVSDLLFIILDRNTRNMIVTFLITCSKCIDTYPWSSWRMSHPWKCPFDSEDEAEAEQESSLNSSANEASIFQRRYNNSGQRTEESDEMESDEADQQLLTIQFIKKYLHYARTSCKPVLTKAAADLIVAAYSEFRQKKVQDEMAANSLQLTAASSLPLLKHSLWPWRTLETLIRLATAHAKARLSSKKWKRRTPVSLKSWLNSACTRKSRRRPRREVKGFSCCFWWGRQWKWDLMKNSDTQGIESDEEPVKTTSCCL